MAYVITQACIGVKDTACVDACPTDSIHGYSDSPQLYIDPVTCIDCDACLPACPVAAIFPGDQVPAAMKNFIQTNVDFFKAFDKSKSVAYAKQKKGEGEKAEAVSDAVPSGDAQATAANWTEQPGWEAEWEKHKNETLDRVEEQKRYGRVRAVYEQEDRYTIRFFLPERTPVHPYVFKYGLPREMPTYNLTAEVHGNTVFIRGRVADPKVAKLNGLANSFPDRFFVEYSFDRDISTASVSPQSAHVVDVVVLKEHPENKAA